MFLIELTYKAPLEQIDKHIEGHRAFLIKYYEAGNFVASGPKVPREGGIILAAATSHEEVANIILDDPFNQNGLADYRIVEFTANRKADNTQDLIN
jgi:uncharacterized protein YciI